jgi:hypothetical protein
LVMLWPAVQFDRGAKPLDVLLLWLGMVGTPLADVLWEQSSSVVVVAIDVATDSIPNGIAEEPVCVRITVTVPAKLSTRICTIASMVLELFIIWVGPGQASSAVVLVETVVPLPDTELCPNTVPNTVGAEAGLTLVAFIVVLMFDSFIDTVEDG